MNSKYYFYQLNRQVNEPIEGRPPLQLGDQSEYVRELQNYLVKLNFLRGDPNGIFGINTQRAVELFQLFSNLPRTGTVDANVWNSLSQAINNPFPTSRPILREGDQGLEVKSLQFRLVVLGFLSQVSPDGVFDEATKNAVVDFQTDRGIKVDGIVGPETWRTIDQRFAAVDANIPTIKPTVQEGDRNDYVKLLQNMLTAFGYYRGNVDGIFGRNTRNAVIKLQYTYALPPTGVVDYSTWEVLDSLLRPTFIHVPKLQEGSTAPEVFVLQEKLKIAGFFAGTITGSFGPETTLAVKNFQTANNLPATGITDRQTWETLFAQTAIFDEYFTNLVVATRPTLKYGDEGEFVKELQRDLKQVLFFNGAIDGKFGQATLDAVKAFQTNNKLTADGVVGRNTWSALIYLYSPLAICPGVVTPPPTTPPPGNFVGVIIDAGHGGADPGAVSPQITEKEYTLKISQYMANRFRELGIPFAVTRDTDESLSREERIRRMKTPFGDVKNAIVISNHLNAGGGEGAEVIYALRNNSNLAKSILTEIGNTGQKTRSVFQRKLPEDPTKDYYYIMRETDNLQTTIVEYGFLDNANDIPRIQKNWDKYAEATVKAVANYMGKPYTPPGSGKVIHVVRPGDTLWSIANRYNTTVAQIKASNNLTSDVLTLGQQLLISGSGVETTPPSGNIVYVVKTGDTLWSIANKFDTTVDAIKQLNNLTTNALSVGQQSFIPGVSITIPPTSPTIYTVQSGDTLWSIANKFNTTVALLISTNNLTSDVLAVGQRLIIPGTGGTGTEFFIHTVQSGDSLWSLASRYNTTVAAIKALNNLTSDLLSVGQELKIPGSQPPSPTYFIHTVQSGDSLWTIANRYDTTVDAIKSLNNITSTLLSVGQELKIPL